MRIWMRPSVGLKSVGLLLGVSLAGLLVNMLTLAPLASQARPVPTPTTRPTP